MEDMVNKDITEFIKQRLNYLDESNNKFKHLIKISSDNVIQNEVDQTIIFKDKDIEIYKGKITTLGSFDLNTKIWLWAWVTPYFTSKQTKHSRDILEYGLKLEPDSNSLIHFYLKNHIISSRIYFDTDIALDVHLAISLYIAKTKFIYPKYDKTLNLIQYFMVN
jgi:hypothetical protein